jgi:hypothetical protein
MSRKSEFSICSHFAPLKNIVPGFPIRNKSFKQSYSGNDLLICSQGRLINARLSQLAPPAIDRDTLDQVLAENPVQFFLMVNLTCAHAAPSRSNEVSSRSWEGRRPCLLEQVDSI